jgi:hypothetical protein
MERIPDLQRLTEEHARYLADQGRSISVLTDTVGKMDGRVALLEEHHRIEMIRLAREEEREKAAIEREQTRDKAADERWDRIEKRVEKFEKAASRIQWAVILAVAGAAVTWLLKGGLFH